MGEKSAVTRSQKLKVKGQNDISKLKINSICVLHYILIFAFCILNFIGCPKPKKETANKRIISLVPSITEIIYALGKDSLLVGNTIYCNYPEAAKQVYKVGDFSNPSLEKILLKKPTVVFATLPEQKKIVDELNKYKISVYSSKPKSVDSIFQEILEIGKLIDASEQAIILVDALKNKLSEIQNRNPNIIDSPKVYIEISGTPITTVGNLSYINELIRLAGAVNVFSDINREYFVTNSEELTQRNPDIIIILHPLATKTQVRKRLGWSQMTAVNKGRIYTDLNPDYFFRPGPRFIYGVEDLANIVQGVWAKKNR
jgi:iron complex transport system substrate-binding protein